MLVNPALASRRRRRPISFGDFGMQGIRLRRGSTVSTSVICASTTPAVAIRRRRRRSGAIAVTIVDVPYPATSATNRNAAKSVTSTSSCISSLLVPNVDEFANDERADDLHRAADCEHLHSKGIG